MKKSLRFASAALAVALAASCAAPAFAAGGSSFTKSETVYAVMNADGSIQSTTVSEHVYSASGLSKVTDQSTLTNIQNTESSAEFTQDGEKLVWNTDDTDVYYKGDTDRALPIQATVTYTFNYKGFDLTLDFQFTWGVDVMQEYYHSTVARFLTNGIDRLYKEAWHPTLNPSGKEQAIRLNNFGQGANNQADDDWVCNGSYLRCNMIQLGYTFNPTLIKKIGLSSLRLYANVNNAFLITSKDYNGYDPDNSSRLGDNKWGANRQFFTYPRPRTFTFGLNVAF